MNWKDNIITSINTFIYDTRGKVLNVVNKLSFVFAFCFLLIGLIEFGFHLNPSYSKNIILFNTIALIIFTFDVVIQVIYSEKAKGYWKPFLYPSSIILIFWLQHAVKIDETFNEIVIENICLTFLSLFYLSKGVGNIFKRFIQPSRLFLYSFSVISFIGGLVLWMPEMTYLDQPISLIDAIFTAISATCVTGLAVVDTGSFFTWKGQIVILILMQLGGIGIISFATFFIQLIGQGLGIHHQTTMDEIMGNKKGNSISLIKEVVIYTLALELLGAFALFTTLGGNFTFESSIQKIYYACFHSISAFCNAGFSLFPDSMEGQNEYVHLVIIGMIIMGSIGFTSLKEIIHPEFVRERILKPWKKWSLNTQIAVYSSFILGLSGMLLIYTLDLYQYSDNPFQNIIASLFQSITTRTAGFNSIDLSQLSNGSIAFMMCLMFIGANSGSTGGGIKTSTICILFFSAINAVRGRKIIKIGNRQVLQEVVNKSLSLFLFAITTVFIGFLLLCITEPHHNFTALLFEEISAVSTTGLSLGLTSDLNNSSKIILILSMLIGRVGLLNLAFSLASPEKSNRYKLPNADIQIG